MLALVPTLAISTSVMWGLVIVVGLIFLALLGALFFLLRKQGSAKPEPRPASRPLQTRASMSPPPAPKPPPAPPSPATPGPRPMRTDPGTGEGAAPHLRRVEPRAGERTPPPGPPVGAATLGEPRPGLPSRVAPEPQAFENKTIKITRPPQDKTVKLLPARFVVEEGLADVQELRFFMDAAKPVTRITFGRAAGPAYVHIQLKPRTVSSRQATLAVDRAGNYRLINHAPATSNPTLHNGRELGVDEEVPLAENDAIAMGEVRFRFKAD
ncbi:MAG: FHA domain-containing protein [Bacteroidota bacterium]